MKPAIVKPDEHKVLHDVTLQDLRTCELALTMLLKKGDLFDAEVVSHLHDTLDRISDARCICQAQAGVTYVQRDEALHVLHLPKPGIP